jgi:hypothetical protein
MLGLLSIMAMGVDELGGEGLEFVPADIPTTGRNIFSSRLVWSTPATGVMSPARAHILEVWPIAAGNVTNQQWLIIYHLERGVPISHIADCAANEDLPEFELLRQEERVADWLEIDEERGRTEIPRAPNWEKRWGRKAVKKAALNGMKGRTFIPGGAAAGRSWPILNEDQSKALCDFVLE